MGRIWTAEEVKAVFREGQDSGEPLGDDKDTVDNILKWMNSGDKDWINIAGMVNPRRPGAILFLTLTEHMFFNPTTPEQDDFLLLNLAWEEMIFYVFSVPSKYRSDLEDLAPKCGVRIADGIPSLYTPDGLRSFPVFGKNCFNLENIKGHPVYSKAYTNDDDLFKHEDILIAKIFDKTLDLDAFRKGNIHA